MSEIKDKLKSIREGYISEEIDGIQYDYNISPITLNEALDGIELCTHELITESSSGGGIIDRVKKFFKRIVERIIGFFKYVHTKFRMKSEAMKNLLKHKPEILKYIKENEDIEIPILEKILTARIDTGAASRMFSGLYILTKISKLTDSRSLEHLLKSNGDSIETLKKSLSEGFIASALVDIFKYRPHDFPVKVETIKDHVYGKEDKLDGTEQNVNKLYDRLMYFDKSGLYMSRLSKSFSDSYNKIEKKILEKGKDDKDIPLKLQFISALTSASIISLDMTMKVISYGYMSIMGSLNGIYTRYHNEQIRDKVKNTPTRFQTPRSDNMLPSGT